MDLPGERGRDSAAISHFKKREIVWKGGFKKNGRSRRKGSENLPDSYSYIQGYAHEKLPMAGEEEFGKEYLFHYTLCEKGEKRTF